MKLAVELVIAVLLAVLSSVATATPKEQYSGFLDEDSYALMKPAKSASGEPVMRWVSPKLKSGAYYQIMMVPTEFYPEIKPSKKLSESTMKEILKYFDDSLGLQLYTVMPVIKNPSPQRLASKALNTLKLKVAITAVNAKDQDVDDDNRVIVGLTTANLKEKDQPVTMNAEYEVVDAATDEVLAVGMRKGIGKPLKNKTDTVQFMNVKPILDIWIKDAGAFFKALK